MPEIVPAANVSSPSVFNPPLPDSSRKRVAWSNLHGSAESIAINEAAKRHSGPFVVVARDARRLHLLEQELNFYGSGSSSPVRVFPDWETLPYDLFSPHQDITSERLRVLAWLHQGQQSGLLTGGLQTGPKTEGHIVLVTVANLMQRLPPVGYVLGHSIELHRGQQLDIDQFRSRLQQSAYYAVSQVAIPGEYAVRGGLVDLFPMGAHWPIRIDLFDDEIESLRRFDPEDQRSGEVLEDITLLPAREFPMDEAAIKTFRRNFRKTFEGDPTRQLAYSEISNGNAVAGLEYYFPLFFEQTASFFDYLPNDTLWLLDNDIDNEARSFSAEVIDRYDNCALDPDRRVLPPESLYISAATFEQALAERPAIRLSSSDSKRSTSLGSAAPVSAPVDPRAASPYSAFLKLINQSKQRLLLAVETAGRRESMESVLLENDLIPTQVSGWQEFIDSTMHGDINLAITIAPLERGAHLPGAGLSVITETQLYGERVFQRRRRSARNRDPEAIIKSLAELKPGDPVVHENHGIGRYSGLTTLGIEGKTNEFLLIQYQGNDKLYVPILSLDRVSRYLGGDSESAPLHKLGSDAWEKARRKAREKAYDVAAELLEVAALRKTREGRQLPTPKDAYRDFCSRFPFEETPDQEQVIAEVLNDLESDQPMDRLVCGDVGFGKTEVALRAAFVAVHNKCQVAILVPTTLLAQQHYQTFKDRFADLPIEVELLSRFRSRKEIDALVKSLEGGYPDIVIGTHRLLQQDIRFKNLGLLIIDEEHRFGVRQKEQLKKLRSEVDILTLSATPIPRTLNLSMSGIRSISLIATPPVDRLSVKTFVRPFNKALIREAMIREIHRGGQVYFLHNEVRTIERMREELKALVPEARIEVGHGQMSGFELERVMRDFYHQRFNVLLCSTIIESGIDVPSANTMIINRADKFGLAQLHQLRGRVGRSHHQAFTYMLIPGFDVITADARKRLDAIDSLEDLGSGFTLASHDLEIRGAGELLGESQSGTIDTVGFTLFAEYLNRAVEALSRGESREDNQLTRSSRAADVNLSCAALLPNDYIPDVHTRLVLYKRIAAAERSDLHELKVEIVDRFGSLPEFANRLFDLTEVSHRAGRLGIEKISLGENGGTLAFGDNSPVAPEKIIMLLNSRPGIFKMTGGFNLNVRDSLPDVDSRLTLCHSIITALQA
ncbi:MAG: transcription-repair-coupling factor [marine bacterium B5-7]|nr:MAG: transcription-repair-coupling factor [marine bacterium B5-7]